MQERFSTHEVMNQSPPFEDVNLFAADHALRDAVARNSGAAVMKGDVVARKDDAVARKDGAGAEAQLFSFGAIAGSAAARDWARQANDHPPVLKTHDAKGRRADVVEFHPAYHNLMQASAGAGLHHLSCAPHPHVIRSALLYLAAQMEAGHCCPMTMTHAAVSVLKRQPETGAPWLAKIAAPNYDARFLPFGEKVSVTIGMGMTEKQGGTDVRANTTRAEPISGSGAGRGYNLTGHKWFMSAPMSDAFLVLAQAPGGLTCFVLPRFKPDGSVNALHFQRLKPKLGNRSNASAEVEFQGAYAEAIGEEGEGTRHIIEMVTETRLDCAVASAGLMRAALAEALHHCAYRTVFQKKLIDQPLMQQVLADMALDVEGAVALAFRLARAFDSQADPLEQAWRRVMTPVAKYWICKIAPAMVAEAMECLGGNGYVEHGTMARIYREVPVNAIWEGSGNVMALDLVRVLQKSPDAAALVLEDLKPAAKSDPRLVAAHAGLVVLLADYANLERNARAITQGLALLGAAIELLRGAPAVVSEAFIATRLGTFQRPTYGIGIAAAAQGIIARAAPIT